MIGGGSHQYLLSVFIKLKSRVSLGLQPKLPFIVLFMGNSVQSTELDQGVSLNKFLKFNGHCQAYLIVIYMRAV